MKDFTQTGKIVGGNEGDKCNYPYRLDTYGCGCSHDCKYCYAKSLLDFRKLWNPENPSIGDISKIHREIRKIPKNTVVRLGGMTDCFQPIEKIHRVTYKTIKALNRRRIEYLIVTKSAIIADDEYLNILDKDLAHVQITVTSTDDARALSYEKASPPSERMKAIERLRVNSWIRKWFDIDYSEYKVKQGSYCHLPVQKKIEYISKIKGFKEMTVCEDESTAYEYWKQNFNHNPNDCCNLRRNHEPEN